MMVVFLKTADNEADETPQVQVIESIAANVFITFPFLSDPGIPGPIYGIWDLSNRPC